MTLEALCTRSSDVLVYDTFNASAAAAIAASSSASGTGTVLFGNAPPAAEEEVVPPPSAPAGASSQAQADGEKDSARQVQRRKRRRLHRSSKNAVDAESQRMAHIAVERNRRRQMNEYLAALRSLMPGSYVHRSDQASVVSGAIDFVKELEQQLQSLEAHNLALKRQLQRISDDTAAEPERDAAAPPPAGRREEPASAAGTSAAAGATGDAAEPEPQPPPFARFFRYPQYAWRQHHHAHAAAAAREEEEESSAVAVADVEVGVVVDAHASLRVMAPRRGGQLVTMVAGLQALGLAVLHLNVATALGDTALYTFSLKVQEGCGLSTAEDIAAAAHHVLRIIDDDATALDRCRSITAEAAAASGL